MTYKKKICAIEFDGEITTQLLDLLGKDIEESTERILDRRTGIVEVDPYSQEELTLENFGGVLSGSKILVSKNMASFAEHISHFCKKEE